MAFADLLCPELQRFRQLTNDARLSVLVTQHKTQEQRLNIGRRVLPTLQDAVHASRYGRQSSSYPRSSHINYASGFEVKSYEVPSTPQAAWLC